MKAAAEHLWTMAITARRLLDEHINLEPTMQLNTGIVEKYWNRERGYRIADILCAFEKLASRFRSIIVHDLDWSAPSLPSVVKALKSHIQLQP
ncbi:hypothetical protein V8E54_002290 [Elaphomyces granulatus]